MPSNDDLKDTENVTAVQAESDAFTTVPEIDSAAFFNEEEEGDTTPLVKPRTLRQRRPHARASGYQPQKRMTVDDVLARFAACDRCSYFLAGYYSAVGREQWQTAVAHMDAGWLTLAWSPHMRLLVEKSYGVSVDVEHYYYESCCPNCQRAFTFWAADEDAQPDFQISV